MVFKAFDIFFEIVYGISFLICFLGEVESSESATGYPPYNIRKGSEEDTYIIELALAGFSEEDVTVTVKESNFSWVYNYC